MRIAMAVIAVAALALAAPTRAAPPKAAAPKQPAAAAAPAQPQPGMFPCRTEGEVCYFAIVTGKSTVVVQYSNAPQSDGIDQKPQNVFSDDGTTPLDLSPNLGRVVMLTGSYDAAKGISKAAVADVASPILTFMIKSQMSGDDQGAGAPSGKGAPKKR
ncbi:MAG: hypothetical protein ACHQAY_09795 [Hyphomicrobiales bacterium]